MLRALVFTSLTLFYFQAPAYSYDFSPHSESQTSKEASRWSLSQWMEQKGKIQWMDIWLNSNATKPNFYEMYLGAERGSYQRSFVPQSQANDDYNAVAGHFGFFIGWFGVYGKYEKANVEDRTTWDALAQLRLIGASDQGSNLTLFYGLHNNEFQSDKVQNQQAGGAATFYLLSPWAVQARYSQYLSATSDLGHDVDGYRFEATTWLEWGAIRAYGTWFHETTKSNDALSLLTTTRREGINIGIRVYLDFKK